MLMSNFKLILKQTTNSLLSSARSSSRFICPFTSHSFTQDTISNNRYDTTKSFITIVSPNSKSHDLQIKRYFDSNYNKSKNNINELFNYNHANKFNTNKQYNNSLLNLNHKSTYKTNSTYLFNNVNNNYNNNNFKLGNEKRFFHSNLPNYFVFSKTLRLVLPFAMSGIRSWIRAGNSYLRFAFICAVMFGTSGLYIFFNQEFAPVTGRSRFIGVSVEEERDLSDLGYNHVMESYAESFLPENNVLQNQVRTIAKRLIPHSGIDLPWECHVINSPEVNAFVLPNGKIFVFTGLFNVVETEDELAAVISHEIGHAIARHSAERMSLLKVGIVFLTITRGLIGDTISGNITTIISTKLLELNYSRMQEIEADIIGVEILKNAGFKVSAAIKVQEKLGSITQDKDDGIMTLLSTHPKSTERVAKISEWIEADRLKELEQPSTVTINTESKLLSEKM